VVVPARAHLGSHEVVVRNNFYDPAKLEVDPGEAVTWRRLEGTHTVTADDRSFGTTGTTWDTFELTMPDADARIAYHCEVHAGMRGVVIVGNPPPPPPGERVLEVRRVPSSDYPTIAAALQGTPVSLIVEVEPGIYHESLVVDPPNLTVEDAPEIVIRGVGVEPGDVVLDGQDSRSVGVFAGIDGVRVENLTVRRYTSYGIWWRGVERFGAREVIAEDNAGMGLYAQAARRGSLHDVVARGSSVSGIRIAACSDCDVVIEGALVEDNLQGILATDAGSLVIRDSTVRGNGVGIVLRTGGTEAAPQRGAHVYANIISDNIDRRRRGGLPSDLPVGAGVWIDGGLFDVVEDNVIIGHSYGIAITGAALGHRVTGNVLDRSAEADLGWDGLGAQVCFEGNRDPDGDALVTMPPDAQTLYACSMPVTVGIPFPVVSATLLAWGTVLP